MALPPRRADRPRADRLVDQPRDPPRRRARSGSPATPAPPRRRAEAARLGLAEVFDTAAEAVARRRPRSSSACRSARWREVAAEIAPAPAAGRHRHRRRLGQARGDRRRRPAPARRRRTSSPATRWPGTEHSGPGLGLRRALRQPLVPADAAAGRRPGGGRRRSRAFWTALGARVDTMEPDHHDLVLAVTSHVPHLIAYTMVGVADHLRRVTAQEVINYSAAGFRDFTRIAASDPTMWRDVFLANKDATLDILGRFTEELFALQRAIRLGDGDAPARLLHPHPRHPPRHHRGRPGHRRPGLRPRHRQGLTRRSRRSGGRLSLIA